MLICILSAGLGTPHAPHCSPPDRLVSAQVEVGQWNSYLSALSPAAREKLVTSFQL